MTYQTLLTFWIDSVRITLTITTVYDNNVFLFRYNE